MIGRTIRELHSGSAQSREHSEMSIFLVPLLSALLAVIGNLILVFLRGSHQQRTIMAKMDKVGCLTPGRARDDGCIKTDSFTLLSSSPNPITTNKWLLRVALVSLQLCDGS